MPSEVTASNPTGVDSFDHRRFSVLPEYAAASKALDELVHALNRSDAELKGQAHWLVVVQEMAAALGYADSCQRCVRNAPDGELPDDFPPAPAPDAAEVRNETLLGQYRCPRCGDRWTCTYAVTAPGMF